MPKRTDISTILIIGAGPIVIGQACEFDYSGTQACKALKAEGYRIVLVNSNPATIMTDPDLADATYIEPITPEIVAKIIEKERGDRSKGFALLPTMGGQTALNCALSLRKQGTLEKFDVEMIGATADAIDKAEDRELFRDAMTKIGLATPRSHQIKSLSEALTALKDIGLPAIIRPSFTMGGTGGGIAYNRDEFIDIVERGIDASPTDEVLIEESVLGWKEFEMEVVRDKKDNCIIICSIENIDPMGVHTGDSITIAPALTLTDKEYQIMRDASLAVLREIGVETGGSNVQFAVNPEDGRMIVIEMNPRVSRSSALASKATGFPIAKVAAKLAVGYTLDEIANDITGGATPASFEPTIDYVVTKIPRFAFEKFPGASTTLTTSMKSVGEAMAIGRTFQESLQKALRSLETGLTGTRRNDDRRAACSQFGPRQRGLAIASATAFSRSFDQVVTGVMPRSASRRAVPIQSSTGHFLSSRLVPCSRKAVLPAMPARPPGGGTMPERQRRKIGLVAERQPEQPPCALDGVQVARHGVAAVVEQRGRGLARARAVEAGNRRAGLLRHQGRFQQALRIDDQVVAAAPQGAAQARRLAPGAAPRTASCASAGSPLCGSCRSPDAARRCRQKPLRRTSRRRCRADCGCASSTAGKVWMTSPIEDVLTISTFMRRPAFPATGRPPPRPVATSSVFRQLRWPSGQIFWWQGEQDRPSQTSSRCSASGGVFSGEVEP